MGHTSNAGADPPGRSAKRRACIAVSMAGSYEVAHVIADIGGRAEMEDEHVLEVDSVHPLRVLGGIFDGHGGAPAPPLPQKKVPPLFPAPPSSGAAAPFPSPLPPLPSGTTSSRRSACSRNRQPRPKLLNRAS